VKPLRITLPHDETERARRYSLPDPDALREAFDAVYKWHHWHGPVPPTREEWTRVLMLASGYLGLTTYDGGQERCVGKLRDIWRARRARAAEVRDDDALDGSGL